MRRKLQLILQRFLLWLIPGDELFRHLVFRRMRKTEYGKINFAQSDFLQRKNEKEAELYLAMAHGLVNDTRYQELITYLVESQAQYYVEKSVSEEDRVFSRGSINAYRQLEEELINLDDVWKDKHSTKELFDPNKII